MTYWLDGAFSENPVAIDIADRGFLLGDVVFETILMIDGAPAFWDAHMERLCKALSALGFRIEIGRQALASDARRLAQRNGAAEGAASLRITVSRGAGERGLMFPAADKQRPRLLMTVDPVAPVLHSSISIRLSTYVRNGASLSARFKTANYLDNIMARREAVEQGCDEAIMLNNHGRVACASSANVFIATAADEIVTPPVEEGALPGIVRGVLLRQSDAIGAPVIERPIEPDLLQRSDVFLTNSLIGVQPAHFGPAGAEGAALNRFIRSSQTRYKHLLDHDLRRRAQQF